MHSAQNFGANNFVMIDIFGIGVFFLHTAFGSENYPESSPVRAVNLSTRPFCTEFRREQLGGDDNFQDRGQLLGPEIGLRDINTEIVTKMVPVRAVDLSIGPFCTEFRRERFRDNATF